MATIEDVIVNVISKYVKRKRKNGLVIQIGMDVVIISLVNTKQNRLKRGELKKNAVNEKKKNVERLQEIIETRVDLEYTEDVRAKVDMNVVMSSAGQFVEVQGTGEHGTFDRTQLNILLDQAVAAITELDAHQRRAQVGQPDADRARDEVEHAGGAAVGQEVTRGHRLSSHPPTADAIRNSRAAPG